MDRARTGHDMATFSLTSYYRPPTNDLEAFNGLVEQYQQRVYSLCYRMLGDPDAAADTTQDVFLAAFRRRDSYQGGSFSAWLMRIATNACYDQLRVRKRRPQISLDAVVRDGDEPPRQFTDPGEAPDERTLRAELAREIQQRLQELPADQRLAVVMSDIQGYTYDEIAAATGWPVGT